MSLKVFRFILSIVLLGSSVLVQGQAIGTVVSTVPQASGAKYASLLSGTAAVTPVSAIAPGTSSSGYADSSSALNSILSGGNITLYIDKPLAVGSPITLYSNTTIKCLPGAGFIELPTSNMVMFVNANPQGPTTADGNGGFVVSNIADHDISVDGCILNFNSTQSVSNSNHKDDSSGHWINGFRLLGVKNLTITNNQLYDAPTYAIAVSNLDTFNISNNYITVPIINGLFETKGNTDGIHVNGPAINGIIARNKGVTGDDFIALNADDGYRPSTGDGNGSHVNYTGWSWGPITDVTIEGNRFDAAYAGIRMLSVGSRVDRIHVLNNVGTTWDLGMQIDSPYAVGAGTPNFGCIDVDGFDVQRGNLNGSGYRSTIYVNGPFDCLTLRRLNYQTAKTSYPYFLQGYGTISNLSVSGLNVSNATGVQNATSLFQTNGTVTNFSVTGVSWLDGTNNTGALIGGTTAPGTIAVSNFSGPNRLFFTTYNPTRKNGDAFSNTYVAVTSNALVNTVFTEAAVNTTLTGTIPATTVASHPWAVSAGGSWTYTTNGIVPSGPANSFATVDIGVATNYNISANLDPTDGTGQIVFRYTDPANYSVVDFSGPGAVTIAGVVGGATVSLVNNTSCVGGGSSYINPANSAYVTVTGNVVTATVNGNCSVSETMTDSSNFAATKVGINNVTGGKSAVQFTSFRVDHQ